MTSSYAVSVALAAPDAHCSPTAMEWVRTEIAHLRAIDPADVRHGIAQELTRYWTLRLGDAAPPEPT